MFTLLCTTLKSRGGGQNPCQTLNYRINNFNLIRLFAALQVFVGHYFPTDTSFTPYLSLFNGVPIFFTLSGFLIYWSYDNNPTPKDYFRNRFLRIYPALICSFVVTVILLLIFGILTPEKMHSSSFLLWIGTQLTFFQEFTPTILRGFGGGTAPNGALWTISVEILLYFLIPVIYHCIKRYKRQTRAGIILSLGIISYLWNQGCFGNFLASFSDNGYYLIFIHPFNQISSMFFFFSIGILVYLYKEEIIPVLRGKAGWLIIGYILLSIPYYRFGLEPGSYGPGLLELFLHLYLVICIFSIAYTVPEFTNRYLGKMDISYGLYIYHFLIIHTFIELGVTRDIPHFFLVLSCCLGVAWLSWTFVEKRVLKLKKKSLYINSNKKDKV